MSLRAIVNPPSSRNKTSMLIQGSTMTSDQCFSRTNCTLCGPQQHRRSVLCPRLHFHLHIRKARHSKEDLKNIQSGEMVLVKESLNVNNIGQQKDLEQVNVGEVTSKKMTSETVLVGCELNILTPVYFGTNQTLC